MTTTRADISHGQHVQGIDFLVRNVLDTPDDVAAYEVEDPADEVLVIAGKADTVPPLTTGDRYRVELAFRTDTSFDEEAKFAEQLDTAADHECPQCGGDIAFSSGLETPSSAVREFLSETDRTGIHLVLGPDSNVTTLSDGDDWRPLRDSQPRVPTQRAEYQCTECTFSAPEDQL